MRVGIIGQKLIVSLTWPVLAWQFSQDGNDRENSASIYISTFSV